MAPKDVVLLNRTKYAWVLSGFSFTWGSLKKKLSSSRLLVLWVLAYFDESFSYCMVRGLVYHLLAFEILAALLQVEKAHNADLHCVDWSPHDTHFILTG